MLTPAVISSAYSSASREINFDVTQLDQKQEQIFYEKLAQLYNNSFMTDGEAITLMFETTAPSTVTNDEILTTGNYEIKFAKKEDYQEKEDYRGREQYARLIEALAKDDGLNLRLYDKLKSLTLEEELLEEVSKFPRIDRNEPKKLIEACLRTVKMNAVERYQTIDDLIGTTFIDNLCKTVGHMDNVENLRNSIYFYADIKINDVTDEELYQEICDRLKYRFSCSSSPIQNCF